MAVSLSEADSPFAWVFRFDSGGQAQQRFDPGVLREIAPGFAWVHLNLVDSHARKWILQQAEIPAEARAVLTGADEHQIVLGEDEKLFGIVSDFTREFDGPTETFCQLRFFFDANVIVTARRHPVNSAHLMRDGVKSGALQLQSPVALFEKLMWRILEAVQTSAEALLADLDHVEDEVLGEDWHDHRRKLGSIRRDAVRLQRVITGMQRAFLVRDDSAGNHAEAIEIVLRKISQRLDSLANDLHSVEARAHLLHEEITSQVSNETNRQLYILTILGTLIMPPTLITGMFGMNVKGLLFGDDENAYKYAVLMCLASSLLTYCVVWLSGRSSRNKG